MCGFNKLQSLSAIQVSWDTDSVSNNSGVGPIFMTLLIGDIIQSRIHSSELDMGFSTNQGRKYYIGMYAVYS